MNLHNEDTDHSEKYFMQVVFFFLESIPIFDNAFIDPPDALINIIKKTLWPLFVDTVQLFQG